MRIPSSSTRRTRTALALLSATLTLTATAALSAQGPPPGDPPSRVARIAFAQGNVSLEPAGTQDFGVAELNYPLSQGDRIYADLNALTELQTGGLAVRLANGGDLTVTTLTDDQAQFALAQGSVRLRTRDLYAPDGQALVEVDTPNATVDVQQPGDIRVDYYPQDGATILTVSSGAAEVSGQGFDQTISGGQSIRLSGFGEVYPEYVQILPPDNLDQFDASRERMRMQSVAFRNQYVDPDMIGAADLDQYGDWQPTPQYGPIWFPRNVGYGWTPYSVGHWANIAPWGYTWVDAEPWGFAPFHYGRWTNFNGRWGWVPGPPPSVFRGPGWGGHPPRPVYSPALVAFVGGGGFSISIGGGGGLTAWFPLGPSEPYVPWYHTSPAYVNRVNVTNVYNTNVTEIHNTYINKTTTVYNVTNVTYVNRTQATVAVNQHDFAAGHSVAQSQPVPMNAAVRQQLTAAPVLQHAAPPPPHMAAPQAVAAKAIPPTLTRPVVQTRQGFQRAGAPPAAVPLRAPTPPTAVSPAARAAMPQPRAPQVIAPAKPNMTPPPGLRPAPVTPAAPARPAPATTSAPIERTPPKPAPAAAPVPVRPTPVAPATQNQPRPEVKPAAPIERAPAAEEKPAPAPKPPAAEPRPAAVPPPHAAPPPKKTPPPAKDDKPKKEEKPA